MIDLRSDTVTRPTPAMLEAMAGARVGDDVFGEDETVNVLQRRAADLFGKEEALFCPSGTMTNQVAIKVHTQPGDEVICDRLSHIYNYEGAGIAFNSGAQVRLIAGDRGRFTAEQVAEVFNAGANPHAAATRLVAIENTVNRAGGSCWELGEIRRIREFCSGNGIGLHLDGARLFNAMAARGGTPRGYGALFDSISICLSKGLGAPVGSLLIGSRDFIHRALRVRKVLGGGMRQAGYLAAAGLHALDHHVDRLVEDHSRAKEMARELLTQTWVSRVLPVESNIVIFELAEGISSESVVGHLRSQSILMLPMGPRAVRAVFHLDVNDAQLGKALETLRKYRG
jgi:threonine aldolase